MNEAFMGQREKISNQNDGTLKEIKGKKRINKDILKLKDISVYLGKDCEKF